jgi:hypothetical protein
MANSTMDELIALLKGSLGVARTAAYIGMLRQRCWACIHSAQPVEPISSLHTLTKHSADCILHGGAAAVHMYGYTACQVIF